MPGTISRWMFRMFRKDGKMPTGTRPRRTSCKGALLVDREKSFPSKGIFSSAATIGFSSANGGKAAGGVFLATSLALSSGGMTCVWTVGSGGKETVAQPHKNIMGTSHNKTKKPRFFLDRLLLLSKVLLLSYGNISHILP